MSSRIPGELSLAWFAKKKNRAIVRDEMRYVDQHRGALIRTPSGAIRAGQYSHQSEGVFYDLMDRETSAEPALIVPPVLSVAEDDPNQELDVTWSLPELYEELFLERSTGDALNFGLLATLAGNVTSYDDAAVSVGTEYFYRIRGRVGGAYSAYSNIDSGELIAAATDFTIRGTGVNQQYQLGDNTTTNRDTFDHIDASADYIQASVGEVDSHFLKADGTIWGCGTNGLGNIGDGTTTTRQTPVQVGTDTDWTEIKGGRDFTIAKKSGGTLWGWGANDGQLGIGSSSNESSPVQVGVATDWGAAVIACGNVHQVVVKADGTLWSTGENWQGQLGLGDFGFGTARNVHTQIGAGTDWATCAGGHEHSLAIKTNGTMWGFGRNNFGQLGTGSTSTRETTPVASGASTDWAMVSCGRDFSIAIKTNGTMWATGRDISGTGQTGQGTAGSDLSTWTQIGTDTDWEFVDCGDLHTLARKTTGALYGWGNNSEGQLGLGDTTNRFAPTQVGSDTDWGECIAGEVHSIALKAT